MKRMKRTSKPNKANKPNRRLTALLAIALSLGTGFALTAAAPPAFAVIARSAEGTVVSSANAPVPGAIVYLKDTKSLSVKTYIADDAGHFRFGQLSQSSDYELWAEANGQRSKSRSISSFDNANTYNFTLKLPAPK